jgi:tetratricopeptide (TPR) repeat protein
VTEAESLYHTITGTHPDDVEAWFLLGDLLFHSNPLRGRSAAEARGAFERALGFEPDHVSSVTHLMRIAAIEGKRDEALAHARRVRELSPESDQALAMRAFEAFALNDEAGMRAVTAELQRARAVTVAIAFSDVALYAGNPAGTEALARDFIEVTRSAEMRALCHILLAHLALGRGRWREAQRELDAAEALDAPWAVETRALFAALPWLPPSAAGREAVAAGLERWNADAVPPSMFTVFAMHNGLHPLFRRYLVGLLRAELGDGAAAREQAMALRALPAPGSAAALRDRLARSVEAGVARLDGRPDDALALLAGGGGGLWFQLTVASPFFAQAFERYARAELLRELGRDTEALGWYASIAERSPYELVYAGPALLRRAEILERQGDLASARAARERFVALWAECDEELRGMGEEARGR